MRRAHQITAHVFGFTLLGLLAACGGSTPAPSTTATPPANPQPLSALATQKVALAPLSALLVAPELGWEAQIPRAREAMRAVDDAIAAELETRGLRKLWITPSDLAASYARNPTYAADPYALATVPLRAPKLATGAKLTEPLASQLRTMVALHEDARLVLLPVELRIAPSNPGSPIGRATMRLVLVDPRYSETRWVGQVQSDTATAYGAPMITSLARRVVDLVVAP